MANLKKDRPRGDSQPQSTLLTAVDSGAKPLRYIARAEVPMELVMRQPSLSAAMRLCVHMSGLDENEICLSLGIDPGHWTRICHGSAHFPTDKFGALMDLCGNEAPLQWLAHMRGYALVVLKSESEKRAEAAEKALADERAKVEWLTQMLKNK